MAGFFQLPGGMNWQRPEYSQPDSFKERDVTVGEGEWKLPGTLTVPVGSGPFPAVVLVHGSGPNDRDETVGGLRSSKIWPKGWPRGASSCCATRSAHCSTAHDVGPRSNYTVQDETVEDAVQGVALLRAQPEVNGAKFYCWGTSWAAMCRRVSPNRTAKWLAWC